MKKIYLLLIALFLIAVTGCNKDTTEKQLLLVSFNSNGGSTVESKEIEKGEKVSKPNDPLKEGYTFDGWYLGNDEWSFIGYVVSNDMTLTAKWSPTIYNIVYHNVEGLDNLNPNTYTIEEEITLNEINKSGYLFNGFYSDGDYTKLITKIEKGTTGIVNLYAKFSNESYNITLDVNGGNELESSSIVAIYNETFVLPSPTRTGYTFDGWYRDNEKIVSNVYSYTNDIELKAKWVANHYTISYDVNGGDTLTSTTQDATYAENYVLPSPTRTGYTFDGWYQNETKIEDGQYTFTSDIELKAKWQIIEYSIIYHVDENSESGVTYTVEDELDLTTPSKEGYNFAGWYLDSNFTKLFSRLVKGTTGDINLYARFTANKYNINLNVNGGNQLDKNIVEIDYHESVNLPTPTRTGYTFAGWFNEDNLFENEFYGYLQDVELKAHWNANEYTITYNANGGNQLNPSIVKINYDSTIALATPTRDDYVFMGWSYNGNIIEIEKYSFAENITLVAEWQKIKYLVSFDSKGGSEVDPQEIQKGEKVSKPNEPLKEGYTFDGWYLGNDEWSFIGYVVTKEITLTAKWVINTYNINYHLDGGINDLQNPYTFTVEDEIMLNNPSKDGFTFVGWYLDNEFVSSIEKIEKGNTDNVDLYAKFAVNTYKIIYDVNGGDNLDNLFQNVVYGESFVLKTPTREGYSFAGWFYNNNLYNEIVFNNSGDIELVASWVINQYTLTLKYYYGDSDLVLTQDYNSLINVTNPTIFGYTFNGYSESLPPSMPADNKTIEATWSINKYTLIIKYNDGLTENTVLTYDYMQTIDSINNPTRLGYTFAGWDIEIPANMPAEDVVINSTWLPNDNTQYTVNHYKQNINNDEYTLLETELLQGITDSERLVSVKDYEGFTKPQEETILITADGSAYVDYYYTRNTVKVTIVKNNGEEDNVVTAKYEAEVNFSEGISREGYTYGGLFLDERLSDEFTQNTLPSSDITLYAWWQEETKPMYFSFILGGSEASIETTSTEREEIVIPYYIGGKLVTSIKSYAFSGCSSLRIIVIPDTVSTIGYGITKNCTNLETIITPSNIDISNNNFIKEVIITSGSSLDYNAFRECSSLVSISIPSTIKSIGEMTFYGCDSLVNVYYNGTINDWCSIAFEDSQSNSNPMHLAQYFYILDPEGDVLFNNNKYKKPTEIILENGITELSSYQFLNFDSVTKIVVPNSVDSIGYGAFWGCSSLEELTIPYLDGPILLFFGGENSNKYYHAYINFQSADGWMSFEPYVTKSLAKVTITNQFVLPSRAFYGMKLLNTINLSNNLTEIGDEAFYGCQSLLSLSIPGGVLSIGKYAFSGCSSLTELSVPNTIVSIKERAFEGCSSLSLSEYDNAYYIGNNENPFLVLIKSKSSDITGCIIKNGCRFVMDVAFLNCSSMTNLTIPDSVTSIGNGTFCGCSSLNRINSEVEGVSNIPNTILYIGYEAFDSCGSLSFNEYDNGYYLGNETNPYYALIKAKEKSITSCEIKEECVILANYAFNQCYSLATVIMPSEVTIIPIGAFCDCQSLTSIIIPDTVVSIEENAFRFCNSLSLINIPNNVCSIGAFAFGGCSSLESIVIPISTSSIEQFAFKNCSMTIYCIADSKPDKWDKDWNPNNCLVKWGSYTITLNSNEGICDINSLVVAINESFTLPTCTRDGYRFGGWYDNNQLIENGIYIYSQDLVLGAKWLPLYTIELNTFGGDDLDNIEVVGNRTINEISTPKRENDVFLGWYFDDVLVELPFTYNGDEVTIIFNAKWKQTIGDYEVVAYSHNVNVKADPLVVTPNDINQSSNSYVQWNDTYKIATLSNMDKSITGNKWGRWDFTSVSDLGYTDIIVVLRATPGLRVMVKIDALTTPSNNAYDGIAGNKQTLLVDETGELIFTWNLEKFANAAQASNKSFELSNIRKLVFFACDGTDDETLTTATIELISISFVQNQEPFEEVIDSAEILSYVGNESEVIIPDIIGGFIVRKISNNAFSGNDTITRIVLPSNVESIGNYAFANMSNLKEIILNKGIKSYGENILLGSTNLQKMTIASSNVVIASFYDYDETNMPLEFEVTLSSLSTNLNNSLFKYITSRTSVHVVLSNEVTGIPSSAFNYVYSLKSVVIPNSVNEIGSYAFYKCIYLQNISIGSGVIRIGAEAFCSCEELKIVNINSIDSWCNITFNNRRSNPSSIAGGGLYLNNVLIENLVIPEGVTTIKQYAFSNNPIIAVTIPNSVTSIKTSAFSDCMYLHCLIIPESVVTIEDDDESGYFMDYVSVVFFRGTRNQWYNIKPAKISSNAEVLYENSVDSIELEIQNGLKYLKLNTGELMCIGSEDNNIEQLIIPEGVISIVNNAFSNYALLKSLTIPCSLQYIGYNAFNDCSNLNNVYITDLNAWLSVRTCVSLLSSRLLYVNGELLTNLVVSKEVTDININSLSGYNELTSIIVDASNPTYDSRNNCNAIIETPINKLIYGNEYTTIPEDVFTIGDHAFANCGGLTSLTIPKSVIYIGKNPFYKCSNLHDIYYEGTEEEWNNITKELYYGDLWGIIVHYAGNNYIVD